MKKFSYTIIDKQGNRQKREAEAENADELLNRLQSEQLTVVSLSSLKEQVEEVKNLKDEPLIVNKTKEKIHNKATLTDLVVLARQLSTMLSAGVTLLRSLDIILLQVQSRQLRMVIAKIKKDVEAGRNFSDSLADHPTVFSRLWANLIQAGEASGNLPLVLERLANYLEARAAFRAKLLSAMIYPVILFVVAVGAIFAFTLLIVPKFRDIFVTLNIELPLITKMLIGLSNFLRHGILYLLASIGLLAWLARKAAQTKGGKAFFDKMILKLPVLGEFIQSVQIEKFASQISMLLEGGVPILYCLEITQQSMDNVLMEGAVRRVKEAVRQGKTFHEPMIESGLFPAMVSQMIAVGEEIGELPKMFKRISKYYQDYVETFVARLTALLEPVMIIFMGLVIGTMVIAMYMPIFQIATGGK